MLWHYFTLIFNAHFLCHPCLAQQVNRWGLLDSLEGIFSTIVSPLPYQEGKAMRFCLCLKWHAELWFYIFCFSDIFCVTPLGFHWFLGVLFFYQSFTAMRFLFICKVTLWAINLHWILIHKLKIWNHYVVFVYM